MAAVLVLIPALISAHLIDVGRPFRLRAKAEVHAKAEGPPWKYQLEWATGSAS